MEGRRGRITVKPSRSISRDKKTIPKVLFDVVLGSMVSVKSVKC